MPEVRPRRTTASVVKTLIRKIELVSWWVVVENTPPVKIKGFINLSLRVDPPRAGGCGNLVIKFFKNGKFR